MKGKVPSKESRFSENLVYKYRRDRGFNQTEFGKPWGVSQYVISNLEKKKDCEIPSSILERTNGLIDGDGI